MLLHQLIYSIPVIIVRFLLIVINDFIEPITNCFKVFLILPENIFSINRIL